MPGCRLTDSEVLGHGRWRTNRGQLGQCNALYIGTQVGGGGHNRGHIRVVRRHWDIKGRVEDRQRVAGVYLVCHIVDN